MRGDGQCQRRTGIGEHVLDAIGRIVRIHRYERGHRSLRPPTPTPPTRWSGASTAPPPIPGRTPRETSSRASRFEFLVEGAVTQLSTLVRQRRPRGVVVRGRGEDLGERARLHAVARPTPRTAVGAPPREQIDVGDDRRRILEDRVEHAQEPRRQRLDGLRIEHVGRERERRVHTVRDRVPRQRCPRSVPPPSAADRGRRCPVRCRRRAPPGRPRRDAGCGRRGTRASPGTAASARSPASGPATRPAARTVSRRAGMQRCRRGTRR